MTPARIDPMQRIALTARPGYVVAARAVNLAGDALRLWVSEATYDMVMGCGADGARLPRLPSHTDAPYDAIVEWSGAGGRSEVSLRGLQTVFPLLTQISRGGVLVASSRCRFAGERTLANAQAFDADGNPVAYDRQAVEAKAAQMQAQQQRAAAYAAEADPLFFKAQRGEASMDDWTAAVEAIRARFPYPSEAES